MAAPKKPEKKPTEYVVLRSDATTGPWTVIGNFSAFGQIAAKKLAAAEVSAKGSNAESNFFVAVPASSFYPQKPVVQMTITFLSAEGTEEPEVDEETEAEEEPDEEPDDEDVKVVLPDEPDDEPEPDDDDDDLGGMR